MESKRQEVSGGESRRVQALNEAMLHFHNVSAQTLAGYRQLHHHFSSLKEEKQDWQTRVAALEREQRQKEAELQEKDRLLREQQEEIEALRKSLKHQQDETETYRVAYDYAKEHFYNLTDALHVNSFNSKNFQVEKSFHGQEEAKLLAVRVGPKGPSGPAMATTQTHCEEKKKEGEALELCLPRKMPPTQTPPTPSSPPPAGPKLTFAEVVAQPAIRVPKRQPQPAGRVSTKPPEPKGAAAKKPVATGVAPGDQAVPPATLGGKKKRRPRKGRRTQLHPSSERFSSTDSNGHVPAHTRGVQKPGGSHSSQPGEEEKNQTCRELAGAATESQKQHTGAVSPLSGY